MNKKDIAEIKKQLTQDRCALTRICGCLVDGEKEKKAEIKEAFLSLPEEEMFKYFEILRKNLSGGFGKNLLEMEFPLAAEKEGSAHEFLMKLRASRLCDDMLLTQFYDRIIETYDQAGNYLILLVHGTYDIPGKSSDGQEMFDASDEVYEYLIASICPVRLSKPGLCYNASACTIENRIRDWIVGMPDLGFVFPAFTERSTDIHSLLCYSKDAALSQTDFAAEILGCRMPLPALEQKSSFNTLIEEALGDDCDFETVRSIHEKLNERMEARKDDPDPLQLDQAEIRTLLVESGASSEGVDALASHYEAREESDPIWASNVACARKFEVRTPDLVIQINPERADLIHTRILDGQEYLVIPMEDHVEVNGITVRPRKIDQ